MSSKNKEDVVLLWRKHQMLYRTEQNSLSWNVFKTRVAFTQRQKMNLLFLIFFSVTSVVSIQYLTCDQTTVTWPRKPLIWSQISHLTLQVFVSPDRIKLHHAATKLANLSELVSYKSQISSESVCDTDQISPWLSTKENSDALHV